MGNVILDEGLSQGNCFFQYFIPNLTLNGSDPAGS